MRVLGARLAVVASLAFRVLASPRAAHGSPADLFGVGARGQALAGAGAADAHGYEAAYGNPALLSRERERQLVLGVQIADFELRAEGERAPGRLSSEAARGTQIGAVLPLPFGGLLRDRLSAGLAVFTPRDLIVRARLLYPEQLQTPLLTDRAQSLSFALALGADLGHGLRFGAGALAIAELVGTAVVRTDASGRVGTVVDDQLVANYAPLVGASFQPTEELGFGLTYRGALAARFDVVVSVFDLGALVIPELHIAGLAQYDPAQLEAGVAYRRDVWTALAGLTYKRWSAFPGLTEATVRCPNGPGSCAALGVADPGFSDTVVPRLAVERRFAVARGAEGSLRGGVFYEPTPVPEQTGLGNLLDADRLALTAGYGLRLSAPLPPLEVGVYYQHHRLMRRENAKGGEVGCPVTLPDCAPNPGAPRVALSGFAHTTGFTLGVRF